MLRRTPWGVLTAASFLATAAAEAANPQVRLETNLGDLTVELSTGDAPQTVSNFMLYVKDGFYADTAIHRVIPGFVIQGGGFTADYLPKETRDPIVNESDNGLSNLRGTIAMARTADPDSATSQFFVNQVDNDLFLDRDTATDGFGYCVFGEIVAGIEVVDLIAAQPTGFLPPTAERPYTLQDVPLEPVVIATAYAIEGEATEVQKVYISYYGRPGDPAGSEYWADRLAASGGDLSAIIEAFGTSQEFDERYGDLDNAALIDTIYQQMFGRAPDAAGRAFYLDLLDTGAKSLQSITLDILNGAQNDDARIIANKLLVADYFTDELTARRLSYTSEDIDAARGVLDLVGATPESVGVAMDEAEAVLDAL